jgi:hypothetical protein
VVTTDGSGIPAKTSKTGAAQNAKSRSALYRELVQRTSLVGRYQRRLSPADIKARLILIIGSALALCFVAMTLGITYALIFVTQPIGAQAPNDAAFIDLLKTLAIFLTGSLGGVLASNGLKDRNDTPKDSRST